MGIAVLACVAAGHGSLAGTGIYVHQVSEADRTAARHMSSLLDVEQREGVKLKIMSES